MERAEADHTAPTTYFAALQDTFRLAEDAAGPVDRFYKIGDHHVRLRLAGSSLVPYITPALEHLEEPAQLTPSALTVCVWDSSSTGSTPPLPVSMVNDPQDGGEIRYNGERFKLLYNLDTNVLSMLDRGSNLALFWVRDGSALPGYEIAAPVRAILSWWMSDHGRYMVHAGAVGTPSGGVLLAGRGGSGKSTTTLSSLLSGLFYVGDDYVLVDPESSTPFVHSLYSSAKLHPEQSERFPQLSPAVSAFQPTDEEKTLLSLHPSFGDRLKSKLPIRAILLPRVMGLDRTRVRKVSPAVSVLALAPSTLLQLPSASQTTLQQIKRLAERVPNYTLELGRDVHEVPRAISELLSELNSD